MDLFREITVGLIIGLVSGVLSGLFIYFITKKRELKYQSYYYWMDFLLRIMNNNKIYMPSEELRNISLIDDDNNSVWYKSIHEILSLINPYESEDREFDEKEEKLAKNVLTALDELLKWKKKNHIK